MSEYELYHHGVKGMKWGVRRKRNMDAKAAGNAAYKKSIAESKASSDSGKIGSGRRAIKAANKARKEAFDKSMYDSASPRQKARYDKQKSDQIKDLKTLRERNKQARRISNAGWGMKVASGILNSTGKTMYNKLKDGTNPAGVATLRGLGYSAKILDKIGSAAIVGGHMQQYANYKNWRDNS